MPDLINKETGQAVHVPESMVKQALESGVYSAPEGTTVALDRKDVAVEASDLQRTGHEVQTTEQRAERSRDAFMEREYGGLGSEVRAGVESFASGATLGFSDAAARALGADTEAMRHRREVNPYISGASEIGGGVVAALASGGTGAVGRAAAITPAGAAARLGSGIAAKGGYRAAALGFGAEGALFGAGSKVSELALSDDPVTLERAVGEIGSGVLYGGALGAGAGVFGKALGKRLGKAKQALDDWRAKPQTAGGSVVDEIDAYHKARDAAFLVSKGEQKAVLAKQSRRMRDALDAPEALAKSPARLRDTLEKETKILKELVADGEEATLAKLAQNDERVAEAIRTRLGEIGPNKKTISLPKKLASEYREVRGLSGSGPVKIKIDDAGSFLRSLETGELAAARREAVAQLPELLEKNLAVRQSIERAAAKTSDLIGEAQGAASTYAIGAVTGLLPGGPIGAIGAFVAPRVLKKVGGMLSESFAKAGQKAAERSSAAIDAFFTVGRQAQKASVPLATKTLGAVSFSPANPQIPRAVAREVKGNKLASLYKERTAEIREQTTLGPSGRIEMKPEARRRIAERLDGVRAVSPVAADQIETIAARRIEFLANKIPKKPDAFAMTIGPDRWRPSEMAIRQFARYVAAVEDPGGVEERLAQGTLSPEDAEAYKAVYPERFEDFKNQVMARAGELRQSLPYTKRLSLSIFTGVPVDPSMHPQILRVLQSSFAEEPGTDGGVQPAKAQPQFGSISKPEATPAQERAG